MRGNQASSILGNNKNGFESTMCYGIKGMRVIIIIHMWEEGVDTVIV